MSKPQDEALSILKAVLDNFFGGSIDVKNMLRRCAHICQILGWNKQLTWLRNELSGYPQGVELPWYRKSIKGCVKWLVAGGFDTVLDSVVEDGHRTKEEPITYTEMDVWTGIDWVLSAAQSGYSESTGRKSSKYISFRNKHVETIEVNSYDGHVFQAILTNIENLIFEFVSESYALLHYSDTLQDIWQAYRTQVDEHLVSIGLSGHLDSIRANLNSNNLQDWKNAMWSCRDILRDTATYLWQDPRKTYGHLPGKGRGGKLSVTQSDYVNRLGAYLHQKSISGTTRDFISAEMERIYHSIDTLNDLDSKAHDVVTLSDARTAAIGTYIVLGELVTRTDMKPITKYQSP